MNILRLSRIVTLLLLSCSPQVSSSDWKESLTQADSLLAVQQIDSAIVMGNIAFQLAESAYGSEDTVVAYILARQGTYFYRSGRYDDAGVYLDRALEIRRLFPPFEHPHTAMILGTKAKLLTIHGNISEAVRCQEKSLAIFQQTLEPAHRAVVAAKSTLALIYKNYGWLGKAERLLRELLAFYESNEGSSPLNISIDLRNLASVFEAQGRYAEAEQLYLRVLHIRESLLGPEHVLVAATLNALGELTIKQSQYALAEDYLNRSLDICHNRPEIDEPVVAQALNSLGRMHGYRGEYDKAESYHKRALVMLESAYGLGNVRTSSTLRFIGNILTKLGKFPEAESNLRTALAIRKAVGEASNPEEAYCLLSIGNLCVARGDYPEAELYLSGATAILETVYGADHLNITPCLRSLARLRRLQDRPAEAFDLAFRSLRNKLNALASDVVLMSEQNALSYLRQARDVLDLMLSCYRDIKTKPSMTVSRTADLLLSGKGLVSDGIMRRQSLIATDLDSTTFSLTEELQAVKFRLSRLHVKGAGRDDDSMKAITDSLKHVVGQLETDLAHMCSRFKEQLKYRDISSRRIAELLPDSSALIEYVQYNHLQAEETSIPRYLAVVVTKGSDPTIVDLGGANDIDTLVGQYRRHMRRIAGSSMMAATEVDLQDYRALCDSLMNRIWWPVEPYVGDQQLLFVAPDGAINMLSFQSLSETDGTYLLEQHTIHNLSSSCDLVRFAEDKRTCKGLFAMGDPDFDADVMDRVSSLTTSTETESETHYNALRNAQSGCNALSDILLSPIPASKREIEQIISGWEQSTAEPIAAFFGATASEDVFKARAPGNRIIHLATHGYFLEDYCQLSAMAASQPENEFMGVNPLLRSGLFLSGANLLGEGTDNLGVEDGILTAYEVSAMDLTGTELVVLSACESALGEVHTGEGMHGLRRSFEMAGARTVISSLWPVPDKITSDILGRLYSGNSPKVAENVRQAQLATLEHLRDSGSVDHPYSWAGFVVIGDWKR